MISSILLFDRRILQTSLYLKIDWVREENQLCYITYKCSTIVRLNLIVTFYTRSHLVGTNMNFLLYSLTHVHHQFI